MTSVTRLKSHQPPAMLNQQIQPEEGGTRKLMVPFCPSYTSLIIERINKPSLIHSGI